MLVGEVMNELTPEQQGILACITCIDQILAALEHGAGSHDWASFRNTWISESDKQVQAIFHKAEARESNLPEDAA